MIRFFAFGMDLCCVDCIFNLLSRPCHAIPLETKLFCCCDYRMILNKLFANLTSYVIIIITLYAHHDDT